MLQPWTRTLSAIAPPWFMQEDDGTLRRETNEDFTDLRILCRYYQIRLLPCVRAATLRTLKIPEMLALIQGLDLNGLTLLVNRMPSAEWCEQLERSLLGTNKTVMVMRTDKDRRIVEVREFCPFNGIFAGPRQHTMPLLTPTDSAADVKSDNAQDAIVLFE